MYYREYMEWMKTGHWEILGPLFLTQTAQYVSIGLCGLFLAA